MSKCADEYYNKLKKDTALLMSTSGLDEDTCHILLVGAAEHHIIRIIKQHLRTPEQKAWLDEHDYSIEELLNGCTTGEHEAMVHFIFEAWNTKLGRRYFGS